MVLQLIGVGLTIYALRELVRVWHEPDNVHWVGPFDAEPELDLEPEMHPAAADGQQKDQKDDGQGSKKEAPKDPKQRPHCPYWQKSSTFEKPPPPTITCGSPLPSEQAKPKSPEANREQAVMKLMELLPKDVRDAILEEAVKIDKTRVPSGDLAKFINDLPPPTPPGPPSNAALDQPPSGQSSPPDQKPDSKPPDTSAPE